MPRSKKNTENPNKVKKTEKETDEVKLKNLLIKYYAHQLIITQNKVPLFALKEQMENESLEDIEIIAYNHYKNILIEISNTEMKNIMEVCALIEISSPELKINTLQGYCNKLKITA